MRIRSATGLTLALALLASPLSAQEVQWRAATARTEKPAPTGNADSRPVTLARPVAVNQDDRTIHDSAVTPVSFRPVGIVRVQTDAERFPAPLPSGPTLPITTQANDDPPQSETIPIRPRPVPAMNEGEERIVPYSSSDAVPSDCSSCATDGDSCCDCCDCCDCSCVCDMCCGRLGRCRRLRCRPATCVVEAPCGCDLCCGATTCCTYCDSCGGCGCGCFVDGCNSRQYFWASAEYLLWAITPDNVSPLLTTGNINDGLNIGDPALNTTQVLYGKDQLANPLRSGARFTLGFWLPRFDRLGVEASYFFLGQRVSNFFAASDSNPIMIRPTYQATNDSNNGKYFAVPTGYPFISNPTPADRLAPTVGDFQVRNTSYLWGLEANLRAKLCCGPCWWVDALVGYRRLSLDESLTVFDHENPGAFNGFYQDQFVTRNTFNAGQVGLEGQWNFFRRWTVGGFSKLALGNVNQVLSINGQHQIFFTDGSTPDVGTGGFLALASNSKRTEADRFAVMPNVGAKIGWNATEHLRLFVGYECLYLSNVIRAGEQVDIRINQNLVAPNADITSTPQKPAVLFRTNDFWAHGVSFGALYYW